MTTMSCEALRRILKNEDGDDFYPKEEVQEHLSGCQNCKNWLKSMLDLDYDRIVAEMHEFVRMAPPLPSANKEVPATDSDVSEDGEVLPGDEYYDEESEYDEELSEFDELD